MSANIPLELMNGVTLTVYYPSTSSVTVLPSGTPIAGSDGTDGADGTQIHYITEESELMGLGVSGDWAILKIGSSAAVLYGPKSAGAWPLPGTALGGATTSNDRRSAFLHMGG